MKRTKVTTRKGSKSKNKKESPEVFVLPPNLLEKLGINLGTYGSGSESTVSSLVTDTNLVSKEDESNENKLTFKKEPDSQLTTSSEAESSIIETAALMKKSVFLSPTFISNNTSVIKGEIEIVGNNEAVGELVSAELIHNECNVKKGIDLTYLDTHKEHVFISDPQSPNCNPISLSTQESRCFQITNGNIEMNHVEMQTLIDDHADEAYSSDGSNSNMGCTVKSDLKVNKNKINIISEQIILPAQFYKSKRNYSPHENSLTHVPLNTTIKMHTQNTIQQNYLNMDVVPNETGNTEPTEITIVCQNSLKVNTSISTEDNEMLHKVNKIAQCAMSNKTKSEFMEDSRQDLEILQLSNEKEVIINYDVVLGTELAIDSENEKNLINKESAESSTNEKLTMLSTNSYMDEKNYENSLPATISNESELVRNTSDCIENKNSSRDQYSHMKINLHKKPITGDEYACHQIISDVNEFNTSEQYSTEHIGLKQDSVTDAINIEINTSIKNQQPIKTLLENLSKSFQVQPGSLNKNSDIYEVKCLHGNSQITQIEKDRKNSVQAKNTSPIFYVKHCKKSICDKNDLVHDQDKNKHINDNMECHESKLELDRNKRKGEDVYENSECHEGKTSDDGTHENIKLKKDQMNEASVQEDKIREIAAYLCQFADMKKRSHVIPTKKNVKSKTPSNKQCTTYPKSLIQGVEKPGGSVINMLDKNDKPIKTYGRRCSREFKTTSYVFKESNASTQSINLANTSSITNFCNEMEVCICYDFGRFKYYDSISSYEHIHFWNNTKTDCKPEIIFSIYSEHAPVKTDDNCINKFVEELPTESSHENSYKLCWNELKLFNKDGSNDCDHKEDNKRIKNKIKKHSQSCSENKSVEKEKCKESQEAEEDPVCQNTMMITVKSSKNCEGISNNKIDPNEHCAKIGQKRKHSIFVDGEPRAKINKQRISKRLSQTEYRHSGIDDEHSTTNYAKSYLVNLSPIKTSSMRSPKNTSILSTKSTNSGEYSSPSLNDTILTRQHQTGSCPSVNETSIEGVHEPIATLNEAKNTPHPRTSIPLNAIAPHYSSSIKTENEIETIICGVCQLSVEDAGWIDHIASEHNYLAWKCGEQSLDIHDETVVREHLNAVAKACGGLTCVKCGLTRKYVKAYLSHVKDCSGINESPSSAIANTVVHEWSVNSVDDFTECSSEVTPSEESAEVGVKTEEQSVIAGLIKCGVCEESMQDTDWNTHRASRHDYLSWKLGDLPLDVNNETAVREHLNEITKACGGLTCTKCGLTRKYVKPYLSHLRRCTGLNESQNISACGVSLEAVNDTDPAGLISNATGEIETAPADTDLITCGVCDTYVQEKDWTHHIASQHYYLAWKSGDMPLDVNDEEVVRNHLYEIAKACGGLTCSKCGLTRKYVKAYLSHIKSCDGLSESQNDSTYNLSPSEVIFVELSDGPSNITEHANGEIVSKIPLVKCGVCGEYMQDNDWNSHIAARHDYLAWKDGDTALDVYDEDAVREHLYEITKACGGLTCAKCGLTRKYVKAYLSHIKSCDGLNKSQNDSTYNVSSDDLRPAKVNTIRSRNSRLVNKEVEVLSGALVKCAVCDDTIEEKYWNSHIAAKHDYLAWKFGDPALDVNDEEAIRDHLYEITKVCGGLTCAKCGLTRKYVKAYLSHKETCNGPDESNDSSFNGSIDDRPDMELVELTDSITNACEQETALLTCGVCEHIVHEKDWYSHIGTRHDYLAWKLGEPTLDVNDQVAVRTHLSEITSVYGGLTCSKCGLTRKYPKPYLTHFNKCNGLNESQNVSKTNSSIIPQGSGADFTILTNGSPSHASIKYGPLVKCSVCAEYLEETHWNDHIASRHDYLAWKDGEKPLNVQDKEAVRIHLCHIKKEIGGLTCAKCGMILQSVKSYLNHTKSCQKLTSDLEESFHNVVLETQVPDKGQVPVSPAAISSLVKCGVCGQYVQCNDWMQHIANNHRYLAWKDGKPPLDVNNKTQVRDHLHNIIREIKSLTCSKCESIHKSAIDFVKHTEICGNDQVSENCNWVDMKSCFKCGVCNEIVTTVHWEKHLSENHDYGAWKDGDTPVNVDDDEEVYQHLYKFAKEFGSLSCGSCGLKRKYVKSYMEHINICKKVIETEVAPYEEPDNSVVDFSSGGTCAVCQNEVEAGKWIQHTQKAHNYLAWREGEKAWNVDDFEDVNQYLYEICKRMNGLTCNKCGIVRKYVKTYLTHIKNCEVVDFNLDASLAEGVGPSTNKDSFQCAMCKKLIQRADWQNHAMDTHYNITWIIGETPIDIKNPYAVERYLKEYKKVYGRLKCNVCGATRASFAGFYAHIIICGKTEEEIDLFRSLCDICNSKYLCIYKNQHAMIHRVQTYTAELKKDIYQKTELELAGKRRAAVKARSVIENYSDKMSKHSHSCESCGFGTDFAEELKTHKCEVSNEKDFSGDESSAAEVGSSDEESGDTDVDSNISNEANDNEADDDEDDEGGDEPEIKKKVRHREPAPVVSKVSRIPFKVEDVASYIHQGDNDFCHTFLTDEILFPDWQCQPEAVTESELHRYLPPLEQSCKVKFDSGWKTLKKFEAKKDYNGVSIFVGASIVCIAWAPLRVADIRDGAANFLAIACHDGPDCPRYQVDETPTHKNLIQIWSFNKFVRLPQIVYGVAHDFGTVWSMDWCPSGARDDKPAGEEETSRLGLLAVACSNGSAYIFAIPYPSTVVKNDQFVHKLKPVAELRMVMSLERKRYQATSVSWSKQKGHTLVLVGYGDGSTAYYDLACTSPLLLTVENDVQVFHPYNDERPHNTCITGTDLYPTPGDAAGSGTVACAAPTGAELAPRAGAGAPGRARLATAALGVAFAPHACCAVLAGDDAIMHTAISELVWVGPGRRLGGVRAAAGCARCGRVVASTPPALRLMRPHPAYYDVKKQVVGMLEMTHLAKKRKKQVNDELAMIVEPLTYDDAIAKYGITFKTIRRNEKALQYECSSKPKAHCPERFPLADVKSMAFCSSRKFHEKLAVATHSGVLFLTTIN